jgi:hypothetical protein
VSCVWNVCSKHVHLSFTHRVAAIADKLGVEFALIHRKRDRNAENAPEKMEILVGDVKDKAIPSDTVLLTGVSRLNIYFSRSQFLWTT